MTYSEYVQKIRLDKAEQLLLTSNVIIGKLAKAAGYKNKGYFYKIFQEKYGITPYRFRKRGQKP